MKKLLYLSSIFICSIIHPSLVAAARAPLPWSGPSSQQMTQLVNDLITFNETKKSSACLNIEFPNLPSSFTITKLQLRSLLTTPRSQCPTLSIFIKDSPALQSLNQLPFYALTAFNYPRHAQEFPPIKPLIQNILKNNVGADTGGWSLTPYHPNDNVFQAYLTQ